MPDYSIPSFTVPSDGIKIDITIPQTQATVVDQSHTYNEAGMTYNQAGVKYGGIQGATQDDIFPTLLVDKGNEIGLLIDQTDAFLTDQSHTYNEAGQTYNQTGVEYGGVNYATEDAIFPSLFLDATTPHLQGFYDQYTPKPIPPANNKNGPGFLMYVNLT